MKSSYEHRYRLFVLGAGFSAPAGLPLAHQLYRWVRANAARTCNPLLRSRYCRDRRRFLDFVNALSNADGDCVCGKTIDIEQFLGFLDVELFLGLKGGDQFAEEGGESQILLRSLIARCLCEYQKQISSTQWGLYENFANALDASDTIVTFNYDTVLETALERVGKAFKLVPDRYKSVHNTGGVPDDSRKEVAILKMHGSIDWFDKSTYLRQRQEYEINSETSPPATANGLIFDSESYWEVSPLVDGPYPDSPFRHIYRIRNIDKLYANYDVVDTRPVLLLPSINKSLFSRQYSDCWWGFGDRGAGCSQVVVIGYSFPPQDRYAIQALFGLIRSHFSSICQNDLWPPRPVVVFTQARGDGELAEFRNRVRFIPDKLLRIDGEGFNTGWRERLSMLSEC